MDKKKLNKNDYIFQNKKGETLIKKPGEIDGLDFLLMNLEDCEVYLMDHLATIYVDDCKNCKVFIGPTEASIFVRDCQGIEVHGACAQFRLNDSTDCDCYVFAQSDPTLESSKNARFAPYNFFYPKQKEHWEKAKLDIKADHWSQVFDFQENKENPNWRIIKPEEYQGPIKKEVEGESEPENPLEINKLYGGTLEGPIIVGSQEQGGQAMGEGMIGFDIKTSKEQSEQVLEDKVNAEEEKNQGNAFEQGGNNQEKGGAFDEFFGGSGQNQEGGNQPKEGGGEAKQGGGDFDDWGKQDNNQGKSDFDDFFNGTQGGGDKPKQDNQNDLFDGGNNNNQQGEQPIVMGGPSEGGSQQNQNNVATGGGSPQRGGADMYGSDIDPEELEKREKLKRLEQQRLEQIHQKTQWERDQKEEKRSKANEYVRKWNADYQEGIQRRKKQNREEEKITKETDPNAQYKNPWEKIVANVALKEGEYPGTKDVTRFKETLVNKKADIIRKLQGGGQKGSLF